LRLGPDFVRRLATADDMKDLNWRQRMFFAELAARRRRP